MLIQTYMPWVGSLARDLASEKIGALAAGGTAVGEVRSGDDEAALADQIAGSAEDLGPVGGEAGDLALVLLILGVPEQSSALDLLAHCSIQICDGCRNEGASLADGHRFC